MRYFICRGPATEKDYAWWSGMTMADARRGIAAVGSLLQRVQADDRTYWLVRDAPDPEAGPAGAHLLQAYDEYVIAYSESRDVIGPAGMLGAAVPGQPQRLHVVVVGGQVVARWRLARTNASLLVDARPTRNLHAAERQAIDAAVDRYGWFAGRSVSLHLDG